MDGRDYLKEFDELNDAVQTVCGYCVRPADFEGTGEPCNHCYVRETYDWYRNKINERD